MNTKDFLNTERVKDEIKSRFNYDPDTGSLTWKVRPEPKFSRFNGLSSGKEVGKTGVKGGYAYKSVVMEVFGRKMNLSVSRICWLCKTGEWPTNTIDHKDRNTINNRWSNLRDVTQRENNRNKSKTYAKK